MCQFVNGAKLITIQQTTHKLVYYGQKSILCRIQTWTQNILVTYLFDHVSAKTVHHNDFFYHGKMYDALVQRTKQDDFKLLLENNFDV